MLSVRQYHRFRQAAIDRQPSGAVSTSSVESEESNLVDEDRNDKKDKLEDNKNESKIHAPEAVIRDAFYVDWDGSDDPAKPRNWSRGWKLWVMSIVWLNVFALDWSSSADSQGSTRISRQFGVSKEVEALSPALYTFGIAAGCLFAGPISETFGRSPVYMISRAFQFAFMLGPALAPNIQTQLVCRFLAGLGASSVLAIHGATYGAYGRSLAWPFVALGSFFGTTMAPIAGGWIANNDSISWRWLEWIGFILSGVTFLITFLGLPETFDPILLRWKTSCIRKVTGDQRYHSEHHAQDNLPTRLKYAFHRALVMTTREYIIIYLGLWLVVVYIVVFGFLQGFTYLFEDTYNFSDGLKGTVFAAVIVGLTLNTGLAPYFARLYKRQAVAWKQAHPDESFPPEYRLIPAFPVAILLPISMFWLGWTNYSSISPWSGLGAVALFGFCWAGIYVSIYNYILDVYGIYAGSALASITCYRYSFSGMMILVSQPMYEGIGTHWTCTILGVVALILLPAPFIFYKFGESVRQRSRYAGANASEEDAIKDAEKS